MLVRDLMGANPISIKESDHLGVALDTMGRQKVRHLVVVDAADVVVGILSDRDLAMFYDPVKMTKERWAAAHVKDLMSKSPVSIGSSAPIEDAAKILLNSGYSGLPVIDNGQLVGFLSEKDFVRHFVPA